MERIARWGICGALLIVAVVLIMSVCGVLPEPRTTSIPASVAAPVAATVPEPASELPSKKVDFEYYRHKIGAGTGSYSVLIPKAKLSKEGCRYVVNELVKQGNGVDLLITFYADKRAYELSKKWNDPERLRVSKAQMAIIEKGQIALYNGYSPHGAYDSYFPAYCMEYYPNDSRRKEQEIYKF